MTIELSSLRLETGDRLTRAEFHRRYCLRPDIKRAELVQGVVYVASPQHFVEHNRPQRLILQWMDAYVARHPEVEYGFGATVYLEEDSEVQPDAFLFYSEPRMDGDLVILEEGYLVGAPPLVVEITASTGSYDLGDKKESYRRAGVTEYIVWRTVDRQLDWFQLIDEIYVRVPPDEHGIITSRTFAGLRLNVPSLLVGDRAGVLAEL